MARKPLADAAASKLAKRQEGKGETPTLITPRKIANRPRSFRLAPVHLERLRRLAERLSEEAGRPISETDAIKGLSARIAALEQSADVEPVEAEASTSVGPNPAGG